MVLYMLLGIRGGRRLYEFERRAASRRRRAEYLSDEVLQAREAAAERGLFGYASYLNARWRAVHVGVVRSFVLVNIRNWIRYKARNSGDRLGRHAGVASAADRHCLLRRIDHGSPASGTSRSDGTGIHYLAALPAPGVLRRPDRLLGDGRDAALAHAPREEVQVNQVRGGELHLSRHRTERSASCWRRATTTRWSVPTGPANPPSPN